jgi:hypothetical protein
MRQTDLERKRTSAWPWLAGLAIFGLILWGVTSLLAAPRGEEDAVAATPAEDALGPAPIPIPPAPIRDMGVGRSIEELSPLGEEDIGEVVRAEGEVVATGVTGFWMVTGAEVIRVDSHRTVRKGEAVTVQGTLRAPDGEERTDEIASEVLSRAAAAESREVVRTVKLVETVEGDGA